MNGILPISTTFVKKKLLTNEILTLPALLLCIVKKKICLLDGWCAEMKKTDVIAVHKNEEINLHEDDCFATHANIFTNHIKHSENLL
jgi:hypothetical protein